MAKDVIKKYKRISFTHAKATGEIRIRNKTPSSEDILARQRVEDERDRLSAADEVCYREATFAIALLMRSGVTVEIPVQNISELAGADAAALRTVSLTIGGDAISVRSLDVDISIRGLLRDMFGLNMQRLGGLATSDKKAAAARENGAKGGRPPNLISSGEKGVVTTKGARRHQPKVDVAKR